MLEPAEAMADNAEVLTAIKKLVDVIGPPTGRMDRDIREIEADVAELKTDVGGLKTDIVGLKTDVDRLKPDGYRLKATVDLNRNAARPA